MSTIQPCGFLSSGSHWLSTPIYILSTDSFDWEFWAALETNWSLAQTYYTLACQVQASYIISSFCPHFQGQWKCVHNLTLGVILSFQSSGSWLCSHNCCLIEQALIGWSSRWVHHVSACSTPPSKHILFPLFINVMFACTKSQRFITLGHYRIRSTFLSQTIIKVAPEYLCIQAKDILD